MYSMHNNPPLGIVQKLSNTFLLFLFTLYYLYSLNVPQVRTPRRNTVLECLGSKALIHQAQGLWTFWENDPGRPRISFRNAFTVEVTHPTLAERLWQRVAPWVRPEVQLSEEDPRFEVDIAAWR